MAAARARTPACEGRQGLERVARCQRSRSEASLWQGEDVGGTCSMCLPAHDPARVRRSVAG